MKQSQLIVSVVFAAESVGLSHAIAGISTLNVTEKNKNSKSESTGSQVGVGENYVSLLKTLDIYEAPEGTKKLITLSELYKLVETRGVALKVSKETLNEAQQASATSDDAKKPTLGLTMAHDQKWTKTMSDSNPNDGYSDRESVSGARDINSSGGLSLTGTPSQGVSYKVLFPQLTHAQQTPSTSVENPKRYDHGAFTSSLELALLKDDPVIFEPLAKRKSDLTLAVAKDNYRAAILKQITDAESSYFGLIQKHLQLLVQRRSFKLAQALERDVKEKISAGESSSLEGIQAELQTAQAQTDYMSAEIDFESSMSNFRSSLAYDGDDGHGLFPDPKSLDIDVEKLKFVGDAFADVQKFNPELAAAKSAKQNAENDVDVARKATLPSLGLSLSYGNGAPGESWPKSTIGAVKPNDRVFSMGLNFSMILYNDTAKNNLKKAIIEKQKAEFSTEEVFHRLMKDYNSLVKKLDIGGRRFKIAKISREIAEKKLNSEYEKFKSGESSVRNVIDSQTALNSARIGEIGAKIELLTSSGAMRSLLGKLPEGVTLNQNRQL